jgi:4'-phosphopantetheinyl transferase
VRTSGFLQQAARERPAATHLPPLERGEVLVWRLELVADVAVLDRLQRLLDDSERARAARFGPEAVRRRFVVARSMLRLLLGHYAGTDPGALPLATGLRGKPALPLGYRLQFNLAHTGDLAMVALVSGECKLGIDVESVTHDVDVQGVAAHAFSAAEQQALRDTPERQRHDAFARIWTRKEAYIKARGEGFSYPTRSFTVSLLPGDEDALLVDDASPGAAAHWRVGEITAPDGFHAALAVAGRRWAVRQVGTLAPSALLD